MSRYYPSQQNTHELILYNTENFLSKMMRSNNKRIEKPRTDLRTNRDRSINRNNNNQLAVSRPSVKPTPVPKVEEPKRKPSAQELIHKEVFNNNMATVEVTVRTVAPNGTKPAIEDKREPWGKLLTLRKSEENVQGSFGSFDPLRTLHFLSKELQQKLQNACPADSDIHQIVVDMQNAVQRLPPDVLTQIAKPHDDLINIENESVTNIKKEDKKVSKQCQTVLIGDAETKLMQQQLEDSAIKLEESCKEMENVCNRLKTEKEELETKLLAEKETVTSLKKELRDIYSKQDEKITKNMEVLESERDFFKKQVTELQSKLDLQSGPSAEDLRSLVDELKNKQVVFEQENTTRRNELTMMKLERDKMNVLLDCKNKQLKELRSELECIQQLVSTQLIEFKAKPSFSTTSTNYSSVSQVWNSPSMARSQKGGKSIHELFLNSDIMRKMLMSKEVKLAESGTITTMNLDDLLKEENIKLSSNDLQEVPQKDETERNVKSDTTLPGSILTETDFMHKLSTPSIRDMFSEIKRQAFKKLEIPLPSSANKSKETTPVNEVESQADSRASLSS